MSAGDSPASSNSSGLDTPLRSNSAPEVRSGLPTSMPFGPTSTAVLPVFVMRRMPATIPWPLIGASPATVPRPQRIRYAASYAPAVPKVVAPEPACAKRLV
jgi:hypothetical protein